jgi:transcriptional regulator with XRE-family HTH domain
MSEQGITQEQLARLSGTHQTTIQRLLAGTAKQSRKLVLIAQALGVNPLWLETGQPPKQWTVLRYEKGNHELIDLPVPAAGSFDPLVVSLRLIAIESAWNGCHENVNLEVLNGMILGLRSFGVLIKGDGYGPFIPSGSVAICDPDQPYSSGDWIFVRKHCGDAAMGRLLASQGEDLTLIPLAGGLPFSAAKDELETICSVISFVAPSQARLILQSG